MTQGWRARLATAGVLALVFGVGALAGIAGDRMLERRTSDLLAGVPPTPTEVEEVEADEPAEPEVSSAPRSRWLIHQVDLTESQRVAVDSVLTFYRAQVRELTDVYNDAYWSAVQSTRDELRSILEEEQRVRYDSLLVENDRRRGRSGNDADRTR
jgi:hypothetical protein